MPWADKGVLVVIKPNQVELQRFGGDKNYESDRYRRRNLPAPT